MASNHGFVVVKELPNGHLIAAGRRRDNIDYTLEGLLVKTDANGDSIWVNSYEYDVNGINSDNYLWDIIQMSDGGFMAAGEVLATPPHVTFAQDPWVIRVDSNGCIMQSCLVGENSIKHKAKSLDLFPNPTNGFINIETELEFKNIQVYNLQGSLLKQISVNERQFELPKETGLYLIRIETKNGQVLNRKIVRN